MTWLSMPDLASRFVLKDFLPLFQEAQGHQNNQHSQTDFERKKKTDLDPGKQRVNEAHQPAR